MIYPPNYQTKKLDELAKFQALIPAKPGNYDTLVHTVATVIIFGAIVTLALMMSNHFHSFPQDLMHAVTKPTTYIALGATAAFFMGGGAIIYPIVSDSDNGKFTGQDHWLPTYIHPTNKQSDDPTEDEVNSGYLDTSTAHSKQCGFYSHKCPVLNEIVASAIMVTAPIHSAMTMVNSVLRAVFVPMKLAWDGKAADIPGEWRADAYRFVSAPFYGAATILAGIYMWVNPRNGLKLVGAIENKWNEGAPLHQSGWAAPLCHSCCSCNPFSIGYVLKDATQKWLRGGGFYVAGCAQKRAIATLDDGNTITHMSGQTHFFLPDNERIEEYTPYFKESD